MMYHNDPRSSGSGYHEFKNFLKSTPFRPGGPAAGPLPGPLGKTPLNPGGKPSGTIGGKYRFNGTKFIPVKPGRSGLPVVQPMPRLPSFGMAKAMAKVNPYGRALSLLLDMYNAYSFLQKQGQPATDATWDMTGWTPICDDGFPTGPPAYYNLATFAPGLWCDVSAVDVPAGGISEGEINTSSPGWPTDLWGFPGNVRWFAIGCNNDIGPNARMGRNQQWHRFDGDLQAPIPFLPGQPEQKPAPVSAPLDWIIPPALIPDSAPIGIPMQHPPAPKVGTKPKRKPITHALPQGNDSGYGPKKDKPKPRPGTRTDRPPYYPPNPPIVIGGPETPNTPPKPGEKEQKLDLWGQWIGDLYGKLTEIRDVVNAFTDALPRHLQYRGGLGDMISNLYANWEHIDWAEAIKNLIENEIQDQAIGRANRAASKSLGRARNRRYLGPRGASGRVGLSRIAQF